MDVQKLIQDKMPRLGNGSDLFSGIFALNLREGRCRYMCEYLSPCTRVLN